MAPDRLPDQNEFEARVRHYVDGTEVVSRRGINWPSGTTVTDDSINERVDLSGFGGGSSHYEDLFGFGYDDSSVSDTKISFPTSTNYYDAGFFYAYRPGDYNWNTTWGLGDGDVDNAFSNTLYIDLFDDTHRTTTIGAYTQGDVGTAAFVDWSIRSRVAKNGTQTTWVLQGTADDDAGNTSVVSLSANPDGATGGVLLQMIGPDSQEQEFVQLTNDSAGFEWLVKPGTAAGTAFSYVTSNFTGANNYAFMVTDTGVCYFYGDNTAVDDTKIAQGGGWSAYLDEGGNALTFKVKYASGTVKTGTVALT